MCSTKEFTLIRGAKLYDPRPRGEKDVLFYGEEIVKIEERLQPPSNLEVEVVEASGNLLVPGFVDSHVHLIGGGGESGPITRVPELPVSEIVEAGVTTVVGVLGTDGVTRDLRGLLAKAKALQKFITAFIYTGSYHLPSLTITGSVKQDIALIEEVIGVKVAISDHRSSQPTVEELARTASEARVGGMLGCKPGIVHTHVGGGSRGLQQLFAVVDSSEIPINQFVPTHVGRSSSLLKEGIEFLERGGYIDLTCPGETPGWKSKVTNRVQSLVEAEAPLDQVTLSSDGNGSMPKFNQQGEVVGLTMGKVSSLYRTFSAIVESGDLELSQALRLVTKNPAERLGISHRKGQIREGMCADLLVLSEDLEMEKLYARGELLFGGGEVKVKSPYE